MAMGPTKTPFTETADVKRMKALLHKQKEIETELSKLWLKLTVIDNFAATHVADYLGMSRVTCHNRYHPDGRDYNSKKRARYERID